MLNLFLNSSQLFCASESCYCDKLFDTKTVARRKLLHREALSTDEFTQKSFYTQKAFTHGNLLHGEAFTDRSFVTGKLFTQRPLYVQNGSRMHKVLPSTALYYKPRRHLPVLLRTTRLAQSTSQFYFVLQNLHKRLPSTTLHCKACAEHVPVLLRTTKLAQRRCTEKLAHGELLHKEAFTQRHFYTETILHRDSFAHKTFARGNLYTEKFLHVASFCTQHAFIQSKLLHTGSFYTLQSFTHRKLSHTLGYTPKGEDEMR